MYKHQHTCEAPASKRGTCRLRRRRSCARSEFDHGPPRSAPHIGSATSTPPTVVQDTPPQPLRCSGDAEPMAPKGRWAAALTPAAWRWDRRRLLRPLLLLLLHQRQRWRPPRPRPRLQRQRRRRSRRRQRRRRRRHQRGGTQPAARASPAAAAAAAAAAMPPSRRQQRRARQRQRQQQEVSGPMGTRSSAHSRILSSKNSNSSTASSSLQPLLLPAPTRQRCRRQHMLPSRCQQPRSASCRAAAAAAAATAAART